MAEFRYLAISPAGDVLRGVMEAPSEAEVVSRLQQQGNVAMRAEPAAAASGFARALGREFGRGGTLTRQEVANITRELAIMLGAGQDLDRALRFLGETAPNARMRGVLEQIRGAVRDGSALAAALARHPRSFGQLYLGLVRAGEAGGQLAPTLERMAMLLERQRSLAATVRSAMVYPALLILVASGAIVFMLTGVLPQFVPLFEQAGAKLPTSTQFLIDAGGLASRYGLFAVLALALAALAARMAYRRPGVRLPIDRAVLLLPVAGGLMREILAARFTRTLGTLMVNGVPLIAALDVVRDALGNRAAMQAVERAAVSAKAGAGLARPLGEAGVFPLRTIYLLRLGEENAQLGPMALRTAEIHEEKARLAVQRLVALLVPAITIAMGAAVAFIVSSLVVAMLSLNDLAQ
ncbi:MAG: type II secretion system F family protein [Acidisphaera sp.]|nr:type II secretion system F family protein [Acidisphaera sp.]